MFCTQQQSNGNHNFPYLEVVDELCKIVSTEEDPERKKFLEKRIIRFAKEYYQIFRTPTIHALLRRKYEEHFNFDNHPELCIFGSYDIV